MTTSATTSASTTATSPADRPSRSLLPAIGGAALLTVPVLMLGAMLTSPEQADSSLAAYITSLARDKTLTAVSAALFHYAWVAIAFGALAGVTLVRGRRGRVLTSIGGVATAFGSIQMSGLLYNDWVYSALGRNLSIEQAVAIAEDMGDTSTDLWLMSAKVFGLLGMPVLLAGLARAGVLSWWLVPVILFPMVVPGLVPGIAGVALGTLCWAPLVLVGVRLLGRGRRSVRVRDAA